MLREAKMPQYPQIVSNRWAAKWWGVEVVQPPPATVPPTNSVAPAVTGNTTLGATLTCAPGTWAGTPTPTFTYQWQRNATNIALATAATRVIAAADQGTTLRCVVTGTNSAGNASANSNNVAIPAALPPAPVVTPGQSFNLVLPATALTSVGFVVASNNPTAFAITAGNGAGFYQINNGGEIMVSVAGSTGLTPGTTNLTITATNAGGTSPGVQVAVIAA